MDDFHIAVVWEIDTRPKLREIVDLGPLVARYKVYAPLRDDPTLFGTLRLQEHRFGVEWGDGSAQMASSTIADAADEAMTAEDFTAFMDRHGFTLDRVASVLGISRRMAAYYKKEHRVPRVVALACQCIDMKSAATPDRAPTLKENVFLSGRHVGPFGVLYDMGQPVATDVLSRLAEASPTMDDAVRRARIGEASLEAPSAAQGSAPVRTTPGETK